MQLKKLITTLIFLRHFYLQETLSAEKLLCNIANIVDDYNQNAHMTIFASEPNPIVY